IAKESAENTAWPRVIPCRIQDGANPDLFVMTLGNVGTPIAQGAFDPVADLVRLKDGSVKSNYYRAVLGVPFYRPLDKSCFPLPPSGWCTWYYYYNRIDADEVKQNAEWIAANLKDYGANYVQIDDGWQGTGAKGSARNWEAINTNRFPQGMAAVARHIKSLGLAPGLWIAPHGQNNDDVVKTNPGVFLLKPDGSTASDTWEGRFLVDPTTPATHEYLGRLFKRMSDWGYDYFKIDGQPIVVDEYRAKKEFMRSPSDDAPGLYRRTLDTIRQAIGPDRYLLGCWGIPLEGAGIMNGSRTGGDIVLGWGGFQVALRPTLQYYFLHNIVWYSDPDVMLVRSPLTLEQARVWATLQGLTGQALMSSDRLMDLGEERVELMRRVYPATDIRPLDLFPTERYKRIWDLKVNHLGRKYDVVGVFNFDTAKADQVYLNWDDLGLPTDQLVHVFDFWNKEYLGAWSKGMAVSVAPTSCRVLTLMPASDRIQLISTSRHLTQGWIDLVQIEQSVAGNSFKGLSKVVARDPYQLRFAFPRGTNYVVKKAVAKAGRSKLPVKISNHQGWASVEITDDKTTEISWEIEFAPGGLYHFPPSEPARLFVRRVGLDGVDVNWQEQYYLNVGYQVYLDGNLLGYTPNAQFPIRGLNPLTNYMVRVKAVWEDGRESARAGETTFKLASLLPAEISLTQLEPTRSTGRWRGFEIDEMLASAPLRAGGKHFDSGLSSFVNSEVEFDLKGLGGKFTSLVAMDDGSDEKATAEFVVIGDGKELWRSELLGKTNASQSLSVAVSGVRKLVLKTIAKEESERRVQVDWIEPKVSRGSPAE
ncbi:MAG TPA: NPCBM/NEW2 domain-containing protein, partial [Candidatus Paceibacterota bacterium]|nr:NPCBM/NEW2 domain-containing protein [Candidatus Paceibacterota bacterium]